ncbi:MAG: hypothetical protein OEU32_13555 [Acidimicrobiia bacterium]|nr:hypothetical protein [Acidimicrobiia bacterium]
MERVVRAGLTPPVRWFMRHQLRRAIGGRPIDPAAPQRGRFTRRDIDQIVDMTLVGYDDLVGLAHLDRLESVGNRLNVRLAVVTVALYRVLLDLGVSRSHACDLVSDAGWRLYSLGTRPLLAMARLRTADRQARVATVLGWLLRFPFAAPGRPGYEVDVWNDDDAMYTTWTWCPPQAFVRHLVSEHDDRGDLEAFRTSWCSYDWALNDVLAGGFGDYSRPQTMSRGDPQCDMRWSTRVAAPSRRAAVRR